MKRLTTFLFVAALTAVAGLSAPPTLYADDIDLYLWKPPSTPQTRPNILIMFSAANTMLYELRYKEGTLKDMNSDGDLSDTVDQVQGRKMGVSRMDALKEAVVTVLDAIDGVNVGFGRFVSSGGSNTPILYPVKYINEEIAMSGTGLANDQISKGSNDVEETIGGTLLVSEANIEMVQQPASLGNGTCGGTTVSTYYYNSFTSADHAYEQTTNQTVATGALRVGTYAATAWLELPEMQPQAVAQVQVPRPAPANADALAAAYWQYLHNVTWDGEEAGEFIKVPSSQRDVPWTKKKVFGDWESPYAMQDNPDPKAGRLIKVAKTLTVSKTGTGTGTVTDTASEINCGSDCTGSYNEVAVTLKASPDAGAAISWSGCTTVTTTTVTDDTCGFTMPNDTKTVTVTFTAPTVNHSLTVTAPATGTGTITSNTGGINCGSTCTASYASGTSVTLTANPNTGYGVSSWGGDCSGTATTCTLSMTAAKTASVTFAAVPTYTLTATQPTNGSITSSVGGINCGATCSATYNQGANIVLTANPATGYAVGSWTGYCGGLAAGTTSCSVNNITAATSVGVSFVAAPVATGTVSGVLYLEASNSLNGVLNTPQDTVLANKAFTIVDAAGTSHSVTTDAIGAFSKSGIVVGTATISVPGYVLSSGYAAGATPNVVTVSDGGTASVGNLGFTASTVVAGLISGIRYAIAGIPQGSTIRCAQIKMTSKGAWANSGNGVDMNLKAQNSVTAAPFAATSGNLSARATIAAGTFTSNVNAANAEVVTIQNTTLTSAVQALVNNANWDNTASVAFLMDKAETNTVEMEFERGATLTLAWEPPAGVTVPAAGNQLVGLRFENIAVPSGVTITDARLTFTSGADASANANVSIRAEKPGTHPTCDANGNVIVDGSGNPVLINNLQDFTAESLANRVNCTDGTLQAMTTARYDWAITTPWVLNTAYQTPVADTDAATVDLKDVVQEVVNTTGWCGSVTPLHLVVSATNADESPLRNLFSYEGGAAKAPKIMITYNTATVQPSSCILQTYRGRILESVDDAEETTIHPTTLGGMYLDSGNLEMVKTSGNTSEGSGVTRTVGLRFQSVPVKRGTTIAEATITFKASANSTGDASMLIYGEKGDTPRFEAKTWNISQRIFSDVPTNTSRKDTVTEPKQWNLLAVDGTGDSGEWRTNIQDGLYKVDIRDVVQAIVNSANWSSYSDMGFYIAANGATPGLREAVAYDANTGKTESAFLEIKVRGLLGEEGSGAITQTVRTYLKQITRELRACADSSCSQLVIDALHEAGQYYLGGYVTNGGNRNNDVYNRVSHKETFTGSRLCYGGGCQTAAEAGCPIDVLPYEAGCAGEKIESNAAPYTSPITSNCSPNHIIMISDGKTTANTVSGSNQFAGATYDHDNDPATAEIPVNMATELGAMGYFGGCAYQGSATATDYSTGAHFFDDNGNKLVDAGERRFGDYDGDGIKDADELTYALLDNQNEKCGPDIAAYLNKKHDIRTHVISFALGTGWQTVGDDPDAEAAAQPAVEDTALTHENERTKEFLRYLAHRGGGFFYEAEDADELAKALIEIISKILSDSASFVAPTLSVNTFNKLYHDDEVYFALFQPTFEHRWAGNIKKYKFNTCTNTANCATELQDKEGKSISYSDDPATPEKEGGLHPNAVELWNTATITYTPAGCDPANPTTCVCTGCDGPTVRQAGAGEKLEAISVRNVYTDKFVSASPAPGKPPVYKLAKIDNDVTTVTPEGIDFDSSIISNTDLGVTDDAARQKLVNWIVGLDVDDEDGDGLKDDVGDKRWVFGDPLHSQPVLITYGKDSNNKSVSKLFVATNEGAVRMLNADTGVEEWAFMPNDMLKIQKLLRENPVFGDQRIYGIDGMPVFLIQDRDKDGFIEPSGSNDANGVPTGDFVWMFIGQRRGGRNLYALDITPEPAADNTALMTALKAGNATTPSFVPKLKWVINGGTGNFANLGQTWSTPVPAIVKYKGTDPSDANVDWIGRAVLLFGGGYDDSLDAPDANPRTSTKGNAVYMVSTNTGELVWWAGNTGSGANLELAGMDYPIPSDLMVMDSDGDGFEDRIYVGDTGAQVWRIDLGDTIDGVTGASGTPGNSIGGMLAKLAPATCTDETVVNGATTYTNTAPNNCYRRFFYPPAIVRLPESEYFNGGYYDAVVLSSGHRPSPMDTTIIDRIYVLRDRARFALTPTDSTSSTAGGVTTTTVTNGTALQDTVGFIFPKVPGATPAATDYDVVGISADEVNITSPKLSVSVDKSTVANIADPTEPTRFFTITEDWMYDATDNQIQDGSNDTELGNVFVDDNELKQLKAAPGWFITLTDKGEKGLSKPLAIEGRAYITTFVPSLGGIDANGCPLLDEGFGRLYALDLLAGRAVTDWNAATGNPQDDMDDLSRSHRSNDLGLGIPASPEAVFRPDGVSVMTVNDGAPSIGADKFVLPKDRIYWLEE